MPKTTIITGTRKGIGRYLVDYYLARGHRVFGCSRSPFEGELHRYTHYTLDVADERAVSEMVRNVAREAESIDVLINNAGIASMNHALLTPIQTVQNIFATNVYGSVLFAREVAKVMTRQRHGRIVNFTTVATPLKLEGEAAYAASKAAVKSFTEILGRELAPLGITVNAVGPTPVATDLIRSVSAEKIDALIARQAVKRLGEYRDISNVIDFFIDDKSDFVTGQNIYLGGV